ncbi:MAG: hypothetical protein IJI16_03775, partial [Atopobiaceae bacterium]|nr:hypothetical protein [Atopobiaceae bacterium]
MGIYSDASMKYYCNDANCNAAGAGARPQAYTDVTITLTSSLIIGEAGSSTSAKAVASVTGRSVILKSINSTLKLIDRTYSKGEAIGGNVDAKNDVVLKVDTTTTMANASIRGYDTVLIGSDIDPVRSNGNGEEDSKGNNVYVRSYVSIYAAGAADAKAFISKDKSFVKAAVAMDDTAVYGADVDIISRNRLVYQASADGYRSSFLASVNKYTDVPSSGNIKATVDLGSSIFYIGDAAAGIVIDISDRVGAGVPVVRTVGLRGERTIWSVVDGTITFGNISNPLKGTLDVRTDLKGLILKETVDAINVYDQNMIPYVRITNRTDLNVALKAITVENVGYLDPTVNGVSTPGANKTGVTGGIGGGPVRPEITVTSHASGDVQFGGLANGGFIANPTGTVSFVWTDEENPGGLIAGVQDVMAANLMLVAPIWANGFTVAGAGNVGSSSSRLNLFATWFGDEAPTTSVYALGDIYFGITDVKFETIAADGQAPTTGAPRQDAVVVSDIVGGATTDLVINTAMTIYRKEGTSIIAMPTPGTLEYTETKVLDLTSPVTINGEALSVYQIGETATELIYML